ncbi:MAG: hypothetical protein LJF04_05125 [Gemmatimonadetes bacterium]|nr:hypothetical protein [Gemmatimonadota bacterium]
MFGKRSSLGVLALGLLVAAASCGERNSPVTPPDPQMAKGGGHTKPSPSTEPELQEFWVYTTGDDQCVHIVMSGTFQKMGVLPAYDYFFNGLVDQDEHFEVNSWTFQAPGDVEYRDIERQTLGHRDICYHGEREITFDGSEYSRVHFKDFPTTDFDGSGGDPIAFILGAVIESTDGTQSQRLFTPHGVVVGGNTLERTGMNVTSVWYHDGNGTEDTFDNVSSFAISHGASSTENLHVDQLSIDNVSCAMTTTTVGSGKDKRRVAVAGFDLDGTLRFGADAPGAYDWAETHVLVFPEVDGQKGSEPIFVSSRKTFNDTKGVAFTAPFSTSYQADLAGQAVYVELAVDYLFGMNSDYVYDPGQNLVVTTAGFGYGTNGNAWSVSTALDDGKFPVAHSNAVRVVCR